MSLENDPVNPPGRTASSRLLVFVAGSAVLPWLGASLTTLAYTWVAGSSHDAASTARDLVWVPFLLVPLVVCSALTPFVVARDKARLRPVFAQVWAVGGLVAGVSAVATIAFAMVLDPSYGFTVAAFGGIFSGYWLYAFFAGALLWRWSAPAKRSVFYANLP